MALYSAGLRRGELINLKVTDIDSQRMLIKVCGAKGKNDRYTLLSERLLTELRKYYMEYRPGHFHDNSNSEGSYSENVHEIGRFIADDGSNFWGVHVDVTTIDGDLTQIILASDRNTGLWIFTFDCLDNPAIGGPFYCIPPTP